MTGRVPAQGHDGYLCRWPTAQRSNSRDRHTLSEGLATAHLPAVMAQVSVVSGGCRHGSYPDDLLGGLIRWCQCWASLGDARSAVDDEVFGQAHGVALAGFDGERDTAVVADVAHLAVLGKVACHDLIAVEANPDDAHLRAAVGVQGHQMRQGRGL